MQKGIYFKGFNGLRFFAAYFVVIFHTELIRKKYDLFNLLDYTICNNGAIAVEFFFVLSGFLITYLLMSEYEKYNTISIKNFYLRRVFRIWPLYFMILLIGLVLIPQVISIIGVQYQFPFPVGTAALLYIFFLPNLVTTLYGSTFLHPLWSIGVEEQFYLMWAPIVKFFKKYLIPIFITIIGLRIAFYAYENANEATASATGKVWLNFINTMKFESMAIGGLGAYLLFYYRDKVLNFKIFNAPLQVIMLTLIFIRILFHKHLGADQTLLGDIYGVVFKSFYSNVITSVLFLWLLVNISSNKKTIISTENKVLDFLGSISYGIYMYHTIIIFIMGILINKFLKTLSAVTATVFLYSIVLGLTVLVSWLSYVLIEKRFLKLGHKKAKPGKIADVTVQQKIPTSST